MRLQPHEARRSEAVERSEGATGHDLAVGLQHYGPDSAIEPAAHRREGSITAPIRVQPHQSRCSGSVVRGEITSYQNLAVRLNHDRPDAAVESRTGLIERIVPTPVRVQSQQIRRQRPVVGGEEATHKNLAVWLLNHRQHRHVQAAAGLHKRWIPASISFQANDVRCRGTVVSGEVSGGENLPIGLHHDGPHH